MKNNKLLNCRVYLLIPFMIFFLSSAFRTYAQIPSFPLDGNPNKWPAVLPCGTSTLTIIAHAVDHDTTNSGLDDTFTGGSKDVNDITTWGWTLSPANSKGDINNSGAALISYLGHVYLYFFGDRISVNGDADIGFWFFQNGGVPQPGGTFSGAHTEGDILIVSNFTNGGGQVTLYIYKWTGGALVLQGTTTNAYVNTAIQNVPTYSCPPVPTWEFNGNQPTYPVGTFFEGFIDLTAQFPNFAQCNLAYVMETRESQSPQSNLNDFSHDAFTLVPEILVAPTPVACNGGSTGSILLTNETSAPLVVQIAGNTYTVTTTVNVSGLSAGNYPWTVVGDLGCTNSGTTTITQPTALTASAVATNPNCFGGTGSIALTVGGGAGGYTFLWSPGGSTAQNPSGLGAGTYTVTVTDANGCTKTASATIVVPTQVTASAVANNPNCFGGTGSITLTVGGGTPGYTFLWSNGSTAQNPSGLVAGTYSVTVTDTKGCTATASATIVVPTRLTASAAPTNPNCFGGTGSIDLTPSGGTPGYTYVWSPGGATTQDLNGLGSGTYSVTVTDSKGCTATASATIVVPTQVTASALPTNPACSTGTGSIDLTPGGGTPGYTYLWSPGGAITQDLSGLTVSGTYMVTVTDSKGCTATASATIVIPPALHCSIALVSNDDCGKSNGSATVSASGGTATLTYAWDDGETTITAIHLTGGLHTVTVTDSHQCTTSCSIVIPANPCTEFCTYTQGKYGNEAHSMACTLDPFQIPTSQLVADLLNQGDLKIGAGSNYILFKSGDALVIDAILPGGGPSYVLSGICTPNGTVAACLDQYLGKQGRINDALLAQTLTLGLNLRINGGLTDVPLSLGTYLTTIDKLDCPEGSGAVPVGCLSGTVTFDPYHYYMLPQDVLCYMNQNGYAMTIGGLFTLANNVLGSVDLLGQVYCGTSTVTVNLNDVQSAVDMINNAFDGCRILVGNLTSNVTTCQGTTSTKAVEAAAMKPDMTLPSTSLNLYPNPFSTSSEITFTVANNEDKVLLEVVNSLGARISKLYEGPATAGEQYKFTFAPTLGSSFYILILHTQEGIKTFRFTKIK